MKYEKDRIGTNQALTMEWSDGGGEEEEDGEREGEEVEENSRREKNKVGRVELRSNKI